MNVNETKQAKIDKTDKINVFGDAWEVEGYTYTVEDSTIARIDDNGDITGLSEGYTKLVATETRTGKTAEAIIKVIPHDRENDYAMILIEDEFTIALKNDGTVWTWGLNTYGELGQGNTTASYVPVQVKDSEGTGFLSNVIHIGAAPNSAYAVTADGAVYAWGLNNYGRLSVGDTTNRKLPTRVVTKNTEGAIVPVENAKKVYGMIENCTIILSDGTVIGAGRNDNGELGTNNTTQYSYAVKNVILENVVDIATGSDHYLALTKNGDVYAGGYNGYGQLGNGRTSNVEAIAYKMEISDVIAIAAGQYHSIMLKADGTVWTTGYNGYGQLGNSTTTNVSMPVQVKGVNGEGYLENIVQIGSSHAATFALNKEGKVYGIGDNYWGELGQGNNTNSNTPVELKGRYGKQLPRNIASISQSATVATVFLTTSNGELYGVGEGTQYKLLNQGKVIKFAFSFV